MNSDYPNKTITIVAVTGHQAYAQSSVYAIERSYEELQKKIPQQYLKCLLVSPEKPEYCSDYIEHLSCAPFSYLEYNLFMLYSLGDLIETDFALVVQNDGFVINGDNWQNEFLDYDYLGAPVIGIFELSDQGGKALPREKWEACYTEMPDNCFEVHNGGFSLRSKKLLQMPREIGLLTHIFPLKPVSKNNIRIQYENFSHHEDIIISLHARKILLENGIKYAPSKLAAYFALETPTMAIKRGVPADAILGCHTMGCLTLKSKTELYMSKQLAFYNNDIRSNDLCHWLLQHKIPITVPKKFLDSDIQDKKEDETN